MTQPAHPTLSPSLIAKLKAMDVQAISDLVASFEAGPSNVRLPSGVARIKASEIDRVSDIEVREQPEPVWPTEPVAKVEDEIFAFRSRSYSRFQPMYYTFLCTSDFMNLAVPLAILSFEHIPDPLLKRWHWWRGYGTETLGTLQAAKELAKSIICSHEGVRYEDANPKTLARKFEIQTERATHVFLTWGDWRGLWAPVYMDPDATPEPHAASYYRAGKEDELRGEAAVRRRALKLARKYDKVVVKPRPAAMAGTPYRAVYLPREMRDKWEVIRKWMADGQPNGCTFNGTIQNLLSDQYNLMPDEVDWPTHPYSPVPDRSRAVAVLKPDAELMVRGRQKEVLEAAAQLAAPGEPVTPTAISKIVGISRNNVCLVIRALRKKGFWPHPPTWPGPKPSGPNELIPRMSRREDEEAAANDIVARLMRLPDAESRRRAMEMVDGVRAREVEAEVNNGSELLGAVADYLSYINAINGGETEE